MINLVFVHGYSVTNLNTYGELPLRLREEAKKKGMEMNVAEIYLGRYISFHDEVRLGDISAAFQQAIKDQLGHLLQANQRFVCITHSTGGPVVRNWWNTYYGKGSDLCPMSHLVMLAPANFGSALAALGKSKLSRLASWFDGVEPGQGVLDWLELGSRSAWELNKSWIQTDGKQIGASGIFPFAITGQSIDRKLYDHLNSYTGELGSDGVVRVAAANLNARYIRLEQPKTLNNEFTIAEIKEAPETALKIVKNKSHSGDKMGIMNSVKADIKDSSSAETVDAILRCIQVGNSSQYTALCQQFNLENNQVQNAELVETDKGFFGNKYYIHDRFSQVIFKLRDSEGFAITDFDLLLTSGPKNDPNALPEGFFADRQQNKSSRECLTYFFNYDIMNGTAAVKSPKGDELRKPQPGTDMLGLIIRPRPVDGFVRYQPCMIKASKEMFNTALHANSTTMIEIMLQRIVSKETFRNEKLTGNTMPSGSQGNFSRTKPGTDILE